MNLIKQVLKDLDKRGASTQIDEATIRVAHTRSAFWLVAAGAVGTLGVGVAAWFMLGTQQRPPLPPVAAVVIAQPVALHAVSAPVAVTAQKTAPLIESVIPNPAMATGAAQIFTIKGSNFSADATVTLRNTKERGEFKDFSIREQAATQIVIKSSFGNKPGRWMVEVHNADGSSSDPYIFTVQAPVTANALRPEQPAMPAPSTVSPGGVDKQSTQISTQQQAENEFRRAYQLMRQGRTTEALAGYEAALAIDPGHDLARQTMVSLLLEEKRNADAERVLQEGLDHNPQQYSFAMLLARLQVGHNALSQALDTLLKTLPYAEQQPEYQSFVAALLQRQSRHAEAIEHYQKALQLKPQTGVWLMGLGISLRAEQRNADACDAFKRALDSRTLNAELQAYVKQQLKEL